MKAENKQKENQQNDKGCKVKKTYPKDSRLDSNNIVSLERLEKALGSNEGYIGI